MKKLKMKMDDWIMKRNEEEAEADAMDGLMKDVEEAQKQEFGPWHHPITNYTIFHFSLSFFLSAW